MDLSARQKAFLLVVLKYQPGNAESLFRLLPEGEKKALKATYDELSAHQPQNLKQVVGSELGKLARPKSISYLSEVHDDWLVDDLVQESPQMIATILRYLPAERVIAIIQQLPEDLQSQLPTLSETYSIPNDLVDILRQKFEGFYLLHKNFDTKGKFEFEHFCLLSTKDLNHVFLELGYREIALGLISLPVDTRKIVLARLSVRDRKHVEGYIIDHDKIPSQRIKRAQVHLVSKEIDPNDPKLFVKQLGFLLYAKSLLSKDLQGIEMIYKKMSRLESTAVRDMVNLQLEKNSDATVLGYREDVISASRKVLGSK
jgi:hypothetical protein